MAYLPLTILGCDRRSRLSTSYSADCTKVSPAAVSGRALYPSAGGGTSPMRTGPDGDAGAVTAGPAARTCDS